MRRSPVCHVCKRAIKRDDPWRVNDAGYQVHVEGACRGPRAVVTFLVGYADGVPKYVGRLPETEADVGLVTDHMVGLGLEVRVKRLNSAGLERLVKAISSGRPA